MADIFGKILSKLRKNNDSSKEIKLENYITDNNSNDNYGILFNDLKKELKDSYVDIEKMPRFSAHSGVLHSMYDELVKPVVLTVMGKYTIGKKTFINSFIGEDILKSNAKYGVSVFIKISYGPKKKVVAYYRDDTEKEVALKDLKSVTVDTSGKNILRKTIKYVEIFLPKKVLKEITIIQTPGLDIEDKNYIKEIKSYLSVSDIAYWISAYGKKVSVNEINTLNEVSKVIKPSLVVNRINEIDEEEEEFEKILKELKETLSGKIEDTLMIDTVLVHENLDEEDLGEDSSYLNENTKSLQNTLLKRIESIKSKYIHSNINMFFEKAVPDFNDAVKDLNELKELMSKEQEIRESHEDRKKYLEPYYEEGVKKLKKKEDITTDFDMMFDAWKNKNAKEYEKIEAPLAYIKSMEDLLRELKVNERIIYNIKSSSETYQDVKNQLVIIDNKYLEFADKEKELTTEADELNKKLDEYYASGIHKEDDKEDDWDETRKELEKWRTDLNKRIRGVELRYMAFEEDRRDQFKRVAVMNQEIFGYIDEYNKILSVKIDEQQQYINECNNKIKKYNGEYDTLRAQVSKVEKILNEFRKIFEKK